MSESCVFIPLNNGEPSQLFVDLSTLTGDRDKAVELYALASQEEFQKLYNLKLENGEPKAVDVIKATGNPEMYLGHERFKDFIYQEENLSKPEDSYESAYRKFQDMREKYPNSVFVITQDRNKYKVSVLDETSREQMNEEERNATIFSRIKNYLHNLGFSISEGSTAMNRTRFSPKEAEKDAEGLTKIIRLAKGKTGLKELPEEFGHLVIEGLRDSPLVQRLLNLMDDEAVHRILRDSYQTYEDLYREEAAEGRFTLGELMKREAAGKLLGDVLTDKILGKEIPIAERLASLGLKKFARGDEATIREILREAYETAGTIVEEEIKDDFRKIDVEKILSGPTLYAAEEKVSEFEKTARDAYFTMVKKMKIFATRKKSSGWDSTELRTVRQMKKMIDAKDYASSIYSFLNYVLKDIRKLKKQISDYEATLSEGTDVTIFELRKLGRILRNISGTVSAYGDILTSLSGISDLKDIRDELAEEDIIDIGDTASDINQIVKQMLNVYSRVRKTALVEFFRYYWGDSKTIQTLNGETVLTIDDILKDASSDISIVSKMVNSMEDMSDPLLTVADSIFKKVFYERDSAIRDLQQEIYAVHEAYVKETSSRDTSFMYEFDENGVPTGMLKSDRDWSRYWKEKSEYIAGLKEEGLDAKVIRSKIKKWDSEHSEAVEVREGFKEKMPKLELYKSDALDSLTSVQKKYYDRMMELKKKLDSLLPDRNVRTYRAVQKRTSTGDALMNAVREGRGIRTIKQMFGALKQKFESTADDTEFGDTEITGDGMDTVIDPVTGDIITPDMQRQILIDFGGNPVSKIPVPYTKKLEDMNYLSLDFTDSLMAYAAVAINYDRVDRVVNMMEVLKEYAGDRMVQQKAGAKSLFEGFTVEGEKIKKEYKKKGIYSQIYQALENAMNKNLYGRQKKEEVAYIGKTGRINYGKTGDALMHYGVQNSMGYNIFSALSNVTMGNVQLLLEAVGNQVSKQGFKLKDIAFAIKEYIRYIPDLIHGYFNDVQSKKIALLIKEFDPKEENYDATHSGNTSRGAFSRIISSLGPMQGQNLGEHYLHNVIMLATLHNTKVEVPGKGKMSLLDAFEVREFTTASGETSYELSLPEGTEFEDKDISVKENLYKIRRWIQGTSHNVNGAYSDIDKGQLHQYVLGRMLMNYRQWMPAFVMNRFKTARYNDAREREEEGFYLTMMKFSWGIISDLFRLKFHIATRWNSLSAYQKGNVTKALTEIGMYMMLAFLLNKAGAPDDDDPYVANAARFLGYRLRVELGSASPFNTDFLDNVKSLMRSPLPALEKTDYLINLLALWDLGDTIESGKYEGWNRYLRNLYYAAPYVRSVGRAIDMGNGNFEMFNIYLKNQ